MKKLVLLLLFILTASGYAQVADMKIQFKDNTSQLISLIDIQQINFAKKDAENYSIFIHKKDNSSEEYGISNISMISFQPSTLDIKFYVHYNGDGSVDEYSTKGLVLTFAKEDTTGVRDYESIPGEMSFTAVKPNPFKDQTSIEFETMKPGDVILTIMDEQGRPVREFNIGYVEPGTHTIEWNGLNSKGLRVAGGMYFCSVRMGNSVISKKIVHVK